MTIMNRRVWKGIVTALAASGLALGACDDGAGDTSEGSSLEISGFALTDDDESDDGFDEAAATEPLEEEVGEDLTDDGASEVPPADELDPEVPEEGPDKIARTVLVVWGQPELNPALAGSPTDWVGSISSDRAALRVLRTVRFERTEPQVDHLVRDEDRQSVSFDTQTTTHHDGVLLRVVMPREVATLGGELVFATDHFTKTIPLGAIVAGEHLTFRADDLGNGLLVASALPSRCPHGITRLHWERKNARGGVFGGKFYGDHGELRGTVVGLWGKVGDKRRFKGVFRDETGAFKGTVRGAWSPLPAAAGEDGGVWRGVWSTADRQVKGVVGGVFRVGDERGEGSAHGFWRSACAAGGGITCEAELALPEPPAPDCACTADAENDFDGACSCDVPPPATCLPAEEPVASE